MRTSSANPPPQWQFCSLLALSANSAPACSGPATSHVRKRLEIARQRKKKDLTAPHFLGYLAKATNSQTGLGYGPPIDSHPAHLHIFMNHILLGKWSKNIHEPQDMAHA